MKYRQIHRFRVVRYGTEFLLCWAILHIPCVWLMYNGVLDHTDVFYASGICLIFLILLDVSVFRKILIYVTSRISFDEAGIHCVGLLKKRISMPWDKCKHIAFIRNCESGEYNFNMICFSENTILEKQGTGLSAYGQLSENYMFIAYSEYLWKELEKYAPYELWVSIKTQSSKIV